MPEEDSHLSDHARSQAHPSRPAATPPSPQANTERGGEPTQVGLVHFVAAA